MADIAKTLDGNKKATYKFGQSDIDLNKYIYNLGTNLLGYMGSLNWNEGLQLEFIKAYERYLAGLKDLSLNNTNRFSTNDAGSILDTTGEFNNTDNDDIDPAGSQYYYDNNGNRIATDDYNLLKGRKLKNYNTFSANKAVATYFNEVGKALRDKTVPESVASNKFDFKKHGFTLFLNKKYAPSGEKVDYSLFWDKDTIDETTGRRDTTERSKFILLEINDYLNKVEDLDFSESPYKNKENFLLTLQNASGLLSNGYNSLAGLALSQAGIGGDFTKNFFSTGELEEVQSPLEKEYQDSEKERQKREYEEGLQNTIYNNNRQLFFKSYMNENPFKSTINALAAPLSYSRENILSHLINTKKLDVNNDAAISDAIKTYVDFPSLALYLRGKRTLMRGQENITLQHIANNLDLAAQSNLFDTPVGNTGYYVIPGTENYDNWSYLAYNPKLRKYEELSMLLNDELKERMAYSQYDKMNKKAVKHLLGGTFQDLQKLREKSAKKQLNKLVAETSGRDEKRIEAGARLVGSPLGSDDEWSAIDYARIGSVAGDVISTIAAFVPGYGTAVSLGTGLASTGANAFADFSDDSMSGWEATKNLGLNVGSDLVGLIPGLGGASKAAKISRAVLKILPIATTIWQGAEHGQEYAQTALKLISNPKEMTVDDWKNLGLGMLLLLGAGRYKAGSIRNKKFQSGTTKATPYNTLRSMSGKSLRVSPDLLDQIKHAKGLAELNKVLKKIYPKEELGKEFRDWTGNIRRLSKNPEVEKGVDYERVRKFENEKRIPLTYTVKDNKIVPKKWTNDWITGKVSSDWVKDPNTSTWFTKENPLYVEPTPPKPTRKKAAKKEEGGKFEHVRKFLDGKKITNTTSTADWFTNMFSSSPMKSWLQGFNKDNFNEFNNLLKSWSTNLKSTQYVPGSTPVSYNKGVFDRLALWNKTGTNKVIEDLATNGVINRPGMSGDNATKGFQDGYFGSLEYLRHGGSKESWVGKETELKQFLDEVRKKGLNYSLDNTSGMYLLLPILETTINNLSNNSIGETSINKQKLVQKLESLLLSNPTDGIFNNPTVMYGLPRAIYADSVNRKMTNLALENEKPFLQDPMLVHRYTRSDMDAEVLGLKNYADIRRMSSKPITSDANLLAAMLLEGEVRGLAARDAGKIQSNQTQRLYDEMAWQQEKENTNNRHLTSIENRLAMLQTLKNKNAYELAYLAKKHNIWDVLGQQVEFDARNKLLENKAIADNFAMLDISNAITYDLEKYAANAGMPLTDIEKNVWTAVSNGSKLPSELSNEEQTALMLVKKKMSMLQLGELRKYKGIAPTLWSGVVPNNLLHAITISKKGGRISIAGIEAETENAIMFQKQIKETIDRNEKVLDRLSKSLYGYIKASIVK